MDDANSERGWSRRGCALNQNPEAFSGPVAHQLAVLPRRCDRARRAGWWVAGILLAAGAIAQGPKLATGWPLYVLFDGKGNVGIGYQADPVAAAPKPLRLCSKAEAAGRSPGTVRVFVQASGALDYVGCPAPGDGQPSVECDGGKPAPVVTVPPGGIYYRPGLASTGRLDLEVSPMTPTPCRVML